MLLSLTLARAVLLIRACRQSVLQGKMDTQRRLSYHEIFMNESAPAISVRNLRKVYGTKAAVDGLTLTVPRGCFFGFLGPNGAGKTTTIRMLMGLATPTSGLIELLGRPMPEQALEVKGRIGLVP